MTDSNRQDVSALPPVRCIGIGELRIYQVSDDELTMIESGAPATTMLNLAIALLGVGGGSIISLLLSEPSKSIYKFVLVVILTAVCVVSGIVLLVLWRKFSKRSENIVLRIRSRALSQPAPGVMAPQASDEEILPRTFFITEWSHSAAIGFAFALRGARLTFE